MTITHDALNLAMQNPPADPDPPTPLDMEPHCTGIPPGIQKYLKSQIQPREAPGKL